MAIVRRPGVGPVRGLAHALAAGFGLPEMEIAGVEATLSRSSIGLSEFARTHCGEGERLVAIVDQFEELFRYRREAGEQGIVESVRFVKLLLDSTGHSELVPDTDNPQLYVVLTMRSDYLGKCALFRGLPEALNDAQYLVPRMSRDQQPEDRVPCAKRAARSRLSTTTKRVLLPRR